MPLPAVNESRETTPEFLRSSLAQWLKLCDQVSNAQRAHILLGNPSPKELADYRDCLKWLLRFLRLIHTQAKDPDFPDRQFAKLIEGYIIQFEEAWAIYGDAKMTPDEADEFLARAFPA